MKKIVLSFAAMLALVTGKAQFNENFENETISSLTNACWIVNGVTLTNQAGETISGTSIYTLPPTNPGTKVDLYTPMLNLLSTSSTIEFDYRLTQSLSGNATRTIMVGLVDLLGNVVSFNTMVINAGNSTAVQHYAHTFSTSILSVNRVFLRIMGSGGNGNVRLVLDNFETTSATLPLLGVCTFTPIQETTLPVKLTSFTATLNNNKVDLKWITESEINTSHFVVERSTDGTNFSEAGIVFAYGTASDKTNYSFPDNISTVTSPVIYYRLRSVDNDAKSQYSETRIVRLSKQTGNKVAIVTFPNPVTTEVRISIPNEWQNKKVIYEIINANGQVTQKMETISSSQTESINTNNLSRGFYIVRVTCEGQTAQQKIVKH